ncbi:hypothetical protein [Streptomyces sp. NPDC026673]|uniref:hypothetical protein n=1 Tax=Streptomyces sp. NPDC026673 TaxID=3155724 RepID=UPI0033DF2E08
MISSTAANNCNCPRGRQDWSCRDPVKRSRISVNAKRFTVAGGVAACEAQATPRGTKQTFVHIRLFVLPFQRLWGKAVNPGLRRRRQVRADLR